MYKLLKNAWLYSWVIIVPLALLASFTDLLLLGGIRLFLSTVSGQWVNFLNLNFNWHKFSILHWTLLMFAIVSARYLLIVLRVRSEEGLMRKLECSLRIWWIKTVRKLHPSNFHIEKTNAILHDANFAVASLPKNCKVITQSVQAISQLVFFLPVLFWLSWKLTFVLIFIFAPITYYLQSILKKISNEGRDLNTIAGEYDYSLWNWTALRKYWNNQKELSKYMSLIFEKIRSLKIISTKLGVKDVTIMQNVETLSIFIMCIVLSICAVLIKIHAMEPFQIILFCAALIICYKPLKECSQVLSSIKDLNAAYSSLRSLEDMEASVAFFSEHEEDCIRIDNLSFKYGKNDPWLFQSLNNVIRLNRPIMLQGENGAGKTTLLRILSGLEIPQGGSIFMPPKAKEGSFYHSQRLFLPPVNWLEQNIKENKWSDTIRKFFDVLGMEELLKKRGHSNGELQRLGLAWAVTSGAPLLFLDESFAYIGHDLREPIFKAFWNATTETGQWWIMASHMMPPTAYQDRIGYWKLEKPR